MDSDSAGQIERATTQIHLFVRVMVSMLSQPELGNSWLS